MSTREDLRPRGTVEVTCRCGASFWLSALHPSLPAGPHVCPGCSGGPVVKDPSRGPRRVE